MDAGIEACRRILDRVRHSEGFSTEEDYLRLQGFLDSLLFKLRCAQAGRSLLLQVNWKQYNDFLQGPCRECRVTHEGIELVAAGEVDYHFAIQFSLDQFFGSMASSLDILARFMAVTFDLASPHQVYFNDGFRKQLAKHAGARRMAKTLKTRWQPLILIKDIRNVLLHSGLIEPTTSKGVLEYQTQTSGSVGLTVGSDATSGHFSLAEHCFKRKGKFIDGSFKRPENRELSLVVKSLWDSFSSAAADTIRQTAEEIDRAGTVPA